MTMFANLKPVTAPVIEKASTTDNTGLESIKPEVITQIKTVTVRAPHVPQIDMGRVLSNRMAVDTSVHGLRGAMQQHKLIQNFTQIAREHSLSSPVVATMRAVPTFLAAASRFPEASLYDVVPASVSSARYAVAMESFEEGADTADSGVSEAAVSAANSFEGTVSSLSGHVQILREQIDMARSVAEEFPDDVEAIAEIPVMTLSDEGFNRILALVEKHLGNIDTFNTDELRANPDLIKEEVDGLNDIVDDLGDVLGIKLGEDGIEPSPRGEYVEPTDGTMGEKGLTKEQVLFYLDKASGIVDLLAGIANSKEEFCASLHGEACNVPNGEDEEGIVYGRETHTTLIGCYVTLTTRLIDESIILVTRIAGLVHSVSSQLPEVDGDAGVTLEVIE